MSITFNVEGERSDLERPETYLNLHNGNAAALLAWLGLSSEPYGRIKATDLASKCRRRLWPESRNEDKGEPGTDEGRIIFGGRAPGTLTDRTTKLLALCERAGEKEITWG